jgi:septum formation protein
MITSQTRPIYLASRSPRRRELLGQIGVRFQLLLFRSMPESDSEVNEDALQGETPQAYVDRVARAKADLGWTRLVQRNLPRSPVLGADTTVTVDGRILGKPANRREAGEMLAALAGRGHEVVTAIALRYEERIESLVSRTEVEFRALSADEIRDYVATGEADDKAGGYAIQGRAAQFVIALRGSYSGVMGLPLYETAQLVEKFSASRERRHTH